MRALIAGLGLASMLATTAAAQLAPFNEAGVTMGHLHFASRDVQANKKIFVAMGGTPITGANETVLFPGTRINLSLGNAPGSGESVGSVVNHVGFIVKNVQEQVAKWKANGVPVLPGTNNRLDQAFVVTPDGVRIEILEDKTQTMPIRYEHVHFSLPEAAIPKAQACMRRRLAERQAPATMPRSWISRVPSSGLPRPTPRKLLPRDACSTTSASMSKTYSPSLRRSKRRASSSMSQSARTSRLASRSHISLTRGARASSWSNVRPPHRKVNGFRFAAVDDGLNVRGRSDRIEG
jgi:catechol 2,3-dioxygenase-like lactoylglutathione lyase family enzyme